MKLLIAALALVLANLPPPLIPKGEIHNVELINPTTYHVEVVAYQSRTHGYEPDKRIIQILLNPHTTRVLGLQPRDIKISGWIRAGGDGFYTIKDLRLQGPSGGAKLKFEITFEPGGNWPQKIHWERLDY